MIRSANEAVHPGGFFLWEDGMSIKSWSMVPAQNNAAPPFGWPEGMPPSGVNDSARQMMADTRAGFEDLPWLEWPDTAVYAGANAFVMAGDLRGRYQVGRRVRVNGNATGTLYGSITGATFIGGQTSVSVAWDAGALQSESLGVALGPAPAGLPIGLAGIKGGDQLATLAAVAQAQVPVGSIIAWPFADPPDGYLLCDGAEVSRATYAELWALGQGKPGFGSGNGTTTFTLPDYRRRMLLGAGGTATATLGNTVGSSGGAESVTLTPANTPLREHRHKNGYADDTVLSFVYGATAGDGGDPDLPGAAVGVDVTSTQASVNFQGWTSTTGDNAGVTPVGILPPAAVISWCIRWRAVAGAVSGDGSMGAGSTTAVLAIGNMGAARALDTLTYGAFTGILNQPTCAVTFDNPNLGAAFLVRSLRLVQDGVGGRAVSWPGNVTWRAGGPPTLAAAPAAITDLSFSSLDGGATWYGTDATLRIEGMAGLQAVLDGKSDAGHTHGIEDVVGLSDALAGAGGGGAAVPVVVLGNMGSAKAINMGLGGAFSGTLNAATCAVTLSNPALGASYVVRLLKLTQDATGGRAVTWPASVTWQGGYAPALGPAAGAVDVILLTSFDGGATWYAAIAGQYPGA